jgi:hypothetical protein
MAAPQWKWLVRGNWTATGSAIPLDSASAPAWDREGRGGAGDAVECAMSDGHICSVAWKGVTYHIGQWSKRPPEVYTDEDVCAYLNQPNHGFFRRNPGLRDRLVQQYNVYTMKGIA